jgi:hypothetical protein
MRERAFFIYLAPENQLRVRIMVDRGEIVDFVVQYETVVNDVMQPVVRYDGSHGQGHRDLLDARGDVIQKDWLPSHYDNKQSLAYAHAELRANWQHYRLRFMEQFS